MRSYAGKTDLEAIAKFLETCQSVDPPDTWPSISEIRLQFDAPSVDQQRDIGLWEDTNGKLMAIAGLMIPSEGQVLSGFLWFRIHPTASADILQKQITDWGEQRMRQVRQERDTDVKLLAGASVEQTERIALLEECGFRIERYFLTMVRSLAEPISEPQFPEGFTLRSIQGEQDAQAWVEMFNQTFIDHWNFLPETVEAFKHKLNNPEFRPDLSLIVIAPDGTFAAFCDCYIPNQGDQGWINPLGTKRGFRKKGLARAMLQAIMQRLQAEGMETAMLYVDAENLSGALRLYESVGFTKVNTQIAYLKEI
jgi:mycothiol synthase